MSAQTQILRAIEKAGRPASVSFQVTDRCNYECTHCYQSHTDHDELSLDQIVGILDQLADLGVLFLTLMGGEFFMRRDADEILQAAHDRGFAIKLLSTGHHIHDKRADFLATLKPLQVDLSVYAADPAVHDGVTLSPGSLERTLSAARRLRERDILVTFKAPVMRDNVEHLGDMARAARELGAEFTFDPMVIGMETGDMSPTHLRATDDQLRRFFGDDESGIWQMVRRVSKSRADLPTNQTPCATGQRVFAITPQGKVTPCQILKTECGDLTTQTVKEVWEQSPQLAYLRELTWDKLAECAECQLKAFCGRCHSMAEQEGGKLEGPSPEHCRQAVITRDLLRERGELPADHTVMPPTWERLKAADAQRNIKRPSALRVLP